MQTLVVTNPATGELVEEVTISTQEETISMINDSKIAFAQWSKVNAHERARLLQEWAKLIKEQREEIAQLITIENGKPIAESRGEVDYGVSYIDWFAEEAKRLYGRTVPANSDSKRIIVTRQPIGVVAAITPWNFPAAMMTRKAAPALAAGCTFIIKPSEETPLTTIKLIQLAHEAGIPEKVIQYVNGDGPTIGKVFTSHPAVRKITFTGSTPVGKLLMQESASSVKHVTMELGGHAPFIVARDADLEVAVSQTISAKFRNAGQTCVSPNRFLVHEDVVEEFTQKLVEKVSKLKVGNGLDEDTNIGPIINKKGFTKIVEQLEDAVRQGAEIKFGNQYEVDEDKSTYFVQPTIITKVQHSMKIMQEETFGPVVPIVTFKTLEEAVQIANSTPYGLAAYFFTNNYQNAIYLNENLDFGIIGWNDGAPSGAHIPFGGMKESGLGREGGSEGIEPYLETKYMSIGNVLHS